MKIAVIGTGGVGGFFGGKLAKSKEDVWFLARGTHLDAMRASGLHVKSTEGDWTVPPGKMTNTPHDIGSADVILFCVKSYDTEAVAAQLEPMLSENTTIISLQNGIDNEEKLQRIIPRSNVLGGVAFIYSTITSPGVVTETGGIKKLTFGLFQKDDRLQERAKHILEVMLQANINAALADDIIAEMWKKFIFIAAVGGMTALTRLTLGEILAVNDSRAMLTDAMRETETIARAAGVNIPNGFTDFICETLKTLDSNSRSSLYHDLVNGKPLEIEALSGRVVALGKALGIATPVHRAMYAALLPYHRKHSRGIA